MMPLLASSLHVEPHAVDQKMARYWRVKTT
jgi:hypothetical protein